MKNSSQKGFSIPLLIAVAVIVIVGGVYYVSTKSSVPSVGSVEDLSSVEEASGTQIIGGDRDAHGCLGPAGYLWSEKSQKCVRPWEENASSTNNGVSCAKDAKMCSDGSTVGRVAPSCEFRACPTSTTSQPSITVLSPNGGETYKKGDTAYIRWSTKNIGNTTLEVDLLKSDGTLVYNLSSMVNPNQGGQIDANGVAYSWAIPSDTSPGGRRIDPGQYKIRLSLTGNSSVTDTSNNYFTITSTTDQTITTYSGGDFSTNGIWIATDTAGKRWTVDYKNAKYFESWISNGQESLRAGDFNSWLQQEKQVSAPNYSGPGISGSINVTGYIDQQNIFHASKIVQHVQ
jgi:hypothetical protein